MMHCATLLEWDMMYRGGHEQRRTATWKSHHFVASSSLDLFNLIYVALGAWRRGNGTHGLCGRGPKGCCSGLVLLIDTTAGATHVNFNASVTNRMKQVACISETLD